MDRNTHWLARIDEVRVDLFAFGSGNDDLASLVGTDDQRPTEISQDFFEVNALLSDDLDSFFWGRTLFYITHGFVDSYNTKGAFILVAYNALARTARSFVDARGRLTLKNDYILAALSPENRGSLSQRTAVRSMTGGA
jgi:hypothetical protein